MVVDNLPAYFHDIKSPADAEIWLQRMLSESRLFLVKSDADQSLIGFLFAYTENNNEAHIGYLLSQENWGKGLASELVGGFIEFASNEKYWRRLIAGVDRSNFASLHLLDKLGFVEGASSDQQVVFYEYLLLAQAGA